MKKVYIAGPITAPTAWAQELHIREAERLAADINMAGAAPFCPHTQSRFLDGVVPWDTFLAADLAWLAHADAVITIPGWRRSEGAKIEVDTAIAAGVPVFHRFGELLRWLVKEGAEE